jgi:hypothetical protein
LAKKRATSLIFAGLFLVLLGAVLAICSRPIFTYTIKVPEQIPRSETVLDESFSLHESQDKVVQVNMTVGRTLDIRASGNENFTFMVANYTDPENVTTLPEPDVTYYMANETMYVNATWSPMESTEFRIYYLVFLARNFPAESAVNVYANITKRWEELNFKTVVASDLKALIDSNYVFLGAGIAVLGGAVLVYAFHHKPKSRSRTLR